VAAIDAFKGKDEDLEKWREGGFTTLALTPQAGIFPGQSSVLNLADGPISGRVVEPESALAVMIPEENVGYSGYPGALLGRVAYVRQVFLDAQWHAGAAALYEDDPGGLERPARDRSMAPVEAALKTDKTVLYPASSAIEIRRALRLAPDLGVERLTIYGVQQAYEDGVAELTAKAGFRAVVDVEWPKERRGADPEIDVPLRVLELRKRAPESPAALAAAGVPFGFYSSKAKAPEELLGGVRKAVEAGLSQDAAIRALTLDAARIHGVERMLGSLEKGKIANVAVFRADPLAEKAKPVMVFVDGVKYEVKP
jgi:imidazolonepropionase-like amidohydrolase